MEKSVFLVFFRFSAWEPSGGGRKSEEGRAAGPLAEPLWISVVNIRGKPDMERSTIRLKERSLEFCPRWGIELKDVKGLESEDLNG